MRAQPIRATLASFLGTATEWYDFYIFALTASLVFNEVFFPTRDPLSSKLAALSAFALGFIARPFGAVIFGHLGDKIGRKKSLIISLLVIGGSTTLIGCLPAYATIGVYASILLFVLRFVQGIAVGGEWGGAVLIAAEHASPRWRTFLAATPQYGFSSGFIIATVVLQLIIKFLSAEEFREWGWRIPFLLSAFMLIITFIIRAGIEESSELAKEQKTVPILEVMKSRKQSIFWGICTCAFGTAGTCFATTLVISYTTNYLGLEASDILDIIKWIGVVEIFSYFGASFCATIYGERKVMVWVSLLAIAWAYPMMALVLTQSFANIAIAVLIASCLTGASYSVMAAYLFLAFPVRMRYTGISISYQISATIFAGGAPLIGEWLVERYQGNWIPLSMLFVSLALTTLLGAYFLPMEEKGLSRVLT